MRKDKKKNKKKELIVCGIICAIVAVCALFVPHAYMSVYDNNRTKVTDLPYETEEDRSVKVDGDWTEITGTFTSINSEGFTITLSDGTSKDIKMDSETAVECSLIPNETYTVYFRSDGKAALIRSLS